MLGKHTILNRVRVDYGADHRVTAGRGGTHTRENANKKIVSTQKSNPLASRCAILLLFPRLLCKSKTVTTTNLLFYLPLAQSLTVKRLFFGRFALI